MQIIAYILSDGRVLLGRPSQAVVNLLMGAGRIPSYEEVEQISRMPDGQKKNRLLHWLAVVASGGLSERDALMEIATKDQPEGVVSIELVDPQPQKSPYYNALKWNNGLDYDMVKAREIHRAMMRVAREPLLEALDVEYMQADESGNIDKKAEISAQKQTLRDITADPAIEQAKTVAELIEVWPEDKLGANQNRR